MIYYIILTHVCRLGNVAIDNLANWGCGKAGINLDIKGEELSQMEGMRNLEEILRLRRRREKTPDWGVEGTKW